MKLTASSPVTTASNGQFLLTLTRIQDYLQLAKANDRLSDLMIIAVKKDETERS
jgi:hypothetical protein